MEKQNHHIPTTIQSLNIVSYGLVRFGSFLTFGVFVETYESVNEWLVIMFMFFVSFRILLCGFPVENAPLCKMTIMYI